MVVDAILLQIGLKCFSTRMTLDLFHEFANTEVLCLFHNMWQSKLSEVNVYFLSCVNKPVGCSLTGLHLLVNWVFDFGWICWESSLLPATSESSSFIQLSLKAIFGGGRGNAYTFLIYDFSRFHHNNFRDTISWERVYRTLILYSSRIPSVLRQLCPSSVLWWIFEPFQLSFPNSIWCLVLIHLSMTFWLSSNFWTQIFHPIVFQRNLRRRPGWRIYFLVSDFSSSHHDSLRDTISWECIVEDDCVRSCL